ncbi:PREDICTED: E3 ubiquitin-protein ligase PDZRN3-like, partial [Priapulus caudatus]|uniref:E3 ubiquitin-protein ligase PDZRN3-like n=1 Tax=Priapulus caudatus TaxID=37621 RepID=A0ABM1EUB0_PRICU
EVTLERLNTTAKLGLTLCYGAGDGADTDIFISEVRAKHFVDCNVCLCLPVLQINGIDVHTRDQAVKLFSEDRPDITLLVARPQFQVDDGFLDEHTSVYLDELQIEMLEQQHRQNMQFTAQGGRGGGDDDGALDGSGGQEKHEKDSGVGRTDESTKNDESSEPEMNETECASPSSRRGGGGGGGADDSNLGSNDSFTSNEHEFCSSDVIANSASAGDARVGFREALETKLSSQDEASVTTTTMPPLQARVDSQSSIDRELEALHREMENIQLECQSIVQNHAREEQRLLAQSPPPPPATVAAPEESPDAWRVIGGSDSGREGGRRSGGGGGRTRKVEEKEKDSSSAYNTGESGHSCRSTPLTLELTPPPPTHANVVVNGNDHRESTMSLCDPERTRERYEERRRPAPEVAETMYTNPEHLQHTILLQQRMLQDRLARQGRLDPRAGCYLDSTLGSEMSQIPEGVEVEWKVKRRADGTRYITRRPVRNRILKDRETKLLEERCGMTTDDDTMSELKVGRYWSKEERKRHLERARDQKRRREYMQRARMESLKEAVGEDGRKRPSILELSQKKMEKRQMKGKKFDDFVTVQEMMVHGGQTLTAPGSKLLSVTTV